MKYFPTANNKCDTDWDDSDAPTPTPKGVEFFTLFAKRKVANVNHASRLSAMETGLRTNNATQYSTNIVLITAELKSIIVTSFEN